MLEALARVRSNAALLGSAGRGIVRLLVDAAMTAPAGAYVGAVLSALLIGVGGNALLLQVGRHPAPLFASVNQETSTASSPITASAAATEEAPLASSAPASAFNSTSAAASIVTGASRLSPVAASTPLPSLHTDQSAARAPDQIGDLLLGKPLDDESRLIRAAQSALAKLGYAVKTDGAEDGATRNALRDFERAHGLALTTEISSQLVEQLTAATRAGR